VTTNNPVLGHASIAPRVATSKLIFCTIPALNPPQRLVHRNELGGTGAELDSGLFIKGLPQSAQERSERGTRFLLEEWDGVQAQVKYTQCEPRYRDRCANDPEIGRDVHYLVMMSFSASVSQPLKRFHFRPNYGFYGFQPKK
jgi:hypothetical protein